MAAPITGASQNSQSCWIDRRVRHRDADQMDQCEGETDREACETYRGAFVGRAEDDDQKHERHDDFAHESGRKRISTR